MKVVTLGEICQIESGGTPSRKSPENFGGNIAWVKIGDMLQGTITTTEEAITELGVSSSSAKVWPIGTLLVSIFATIGRTAVLGIPAASNQAIAGLQVDSNRMFTNYLRHYLDSSVGALVASGRGIAQNNINLSMLKGWPVPVPSLDEQRRIAAILDRADELRTKRRQALAHLEILTQSIFRSMFGTPGEGWRKARLDDICDVSSGITKGRKTAAEGLTDYPYLAVSNVQDRSLNMSVVKEIAVSAHEAERYRLRRGDLLLTEGGDPDKLGRGTIWNDDLPWCLHQNHVFRVRPRSVEAVPVYLSWHLASPAAKSYFLRMAKQTTGIASINKTQLSATPVILPPRELQQTFAARVAAVERLKENHRKHLTELDALFASLQHRAFKGEL